MKISNLKHGDYFVSLRPDFGLVIFCEVMEHTSYPEDDESIAEGRSRGYVFGKCYSIACTDGELGSTHISNISFKLSKKLFERARARGFDTPELFAVGDNFNGLEAPSGRGPQYLTLSDAAQVTGDPRYLPGGAAIFYARNPTFMVDTHDVSELPRTHVRVGDVNEADEEQIYAMMQGETWSPRGEARDLIIGLGLHHTSMSVGDAIVFEEGRAVVIAPFGFEELSWSGRLRVGKH